MFRKKWALGTENLYKPPKTPDTERFSIRNTICKWRKKEKIGNTKACYNRQQQHRIFSHSALLVHILPAQAVHAFCQHFPPLPSALSCPFLPPVQPRAPTQPWQWPSLTKPLQNLSWAPQLDRIILLNLPCDLSLLWCPWGHRCALLVPSVPSSCIA